MVVHSLQPQVITSVPIIDLSCKRSHVSDLIVKACEEYGFFKIINHGVSKDIVSRMEQEGLDFFAKQVLEKQKIGPPDPLGYGVKDIGFNGDVGELEYLLLHTSPEYVSEMSTFISNDPKKFSSILNDYTKAMRELACEILDLMAEGLRVHDRSFFSSLIKAVDSDTLVRFNHYPSCKDMYHPRHSNRIGFGAHSDPQILTLLRSNDVEGLQICMDDGVWVPIQPDPNAFCVNVGDTLQALTNGRFGSVRHRVIANSLKPRMSMLYFAGPSLNTSISPPPELVTSLSPCLYRPFTWAEYKKTTYSLSLAESRLDLFRSHKQNNVFA
ncbi:hypothetical protein GIB67_024039 [Kingdonia uniflora]|uniref:gibberellin 2beta-dioxygenase n=1 Tax=Kingdonia uniflora TaxID=39325 RepID=A0A7J7LB33_9MAGN|nr:hypothetical protein GIB67_024039 [Kingdonia uniflora]